MQYLFDLTPQSDGTLLVTSPDLPQLAFEADTQAEALTLAAQSIEEVLHFTILEGGRIRPMGAADADSPHRHAIPVPPVLAAKVRLYTLTQNSGQPFEQLAAKLGLTPEKLADLIDPREPARLDQLQPLIARLQQGS